jgi:hypothetical protein
VHQEIIIPKTFGDLMVKSFSANVNGIQVPDNIITIDDFSPENRVIHLVLNQNDISQLSKKIQDYPSQIHFSIMPSAKNLPLTTMTENAQFRINLSWEPQNIKSSSKTTFFFDILDVFLVDRPVSVSYDLSIFHNGKKIAQTSGVSTDMGHNMVEFDMPDDVTGVVTLQFENLNGSDLADATLPVVVNRDNTDEAEIPTWIKNNAGWWATDQIDDFAFLQGIQYLIQEGIMIIPPTETTEASESQEVPSWIKNNAGWWADGQIDDETFVSGIQYLIKVGVIKVS